MRFKNIKHIHVILLVWLGVAASMTNSCTDTETTPATFDLIQTKILNTSCAVSGCHSSVEDGSYLQHGLVLETSVAYNNLVNKSPKNQQALADGLSRVLPFNSEKSLLFHKIHSSAAEHHSADYGLPMPLGYELLSEGQVEFIRRWIEGGAPQTGSVVDDLALLEDTTPQPENFEPLQPPDNGVQINTGKFEVAPNFEREFFVYKKLGNTEDMYVNRVEIKMRQNSHHFLLYDFNSEITQLPALNQVRDIRNANGSMNTLNMLPMLYHVYVAGSQTPYMDYKFPEGVALKFPAGAAIDFNSHYVNKQGVTIEGEVNVNLHSIPAASVQKVAKTLNLGNNSLNLPAKQKSTVTKTFKFDKKTYVFALTSHTHKLGEKFIIKIAGGARDGEIVYTNTDWHHPVTVNYPTPIVLSPGEGLTSEITYNNVTTKTVYFGLTSEDEMGIIFGYCYED